MQQCDICERATRLIRAAADWLRRALHRLEKALADFLEEGD